MTPGHRRVDLGLAEMEGDYVNVSPSQDTRLTEIRELVHASQESREI